MNIGTTFRWKRYIVLCMSFLTIAFMAGYSFSGEKTPEAKETETAVILDAIKSTDKAAELKTQLEHPDKVVRSAAVSRLGEIGGPEAVDLLNKAFRKAPRVRGTHAGTGMKREAINALVRIGGEEARKALHAIIREQLEEGPLVKTDYSHIYDPQYYAVTRDAIRSLASFPDEETITLLKSISGNTSLFYSLREQAAISLLAIEMEAKGLKDAGEKTKFLLVQIDPEGVFIEDWWEKPGTKTPAAIRDSAIEQLVEEIGWDSVDALISHLEKNTSGSRARCTAAARMLSSILFLEVHSREFKSPAKKHIRAASTVLKYLEDLTEAESSSPTVTEIYRNIRASADALHDKTIWERLRGLRNKFRSPAAWKGSAPTEKQLGFALPEGSVFIEEFSSRVESPFGTLLRAYYFVDRPAEEIVAHFRKATGGEVRQKTRLLSSGKYETLTTIPLRSTPAQFAPFIELSVTVFSADDPYILKPFGTTLRSAKTKFRITTLLR